jgi:prepilin-type N-terminal cleavage/methylation domain-containing protein
VRALKPWRPRAETEPVRSLLRDARGFTLIEVSIASVVLLVGTLAVVAVANVANQQTARTKGREAATGLARQLIEDVRSIPFESLEQTSIEQHLRAQPGLGSVPGSSSYTIRRRAFTYSIDTSVCTLDDPRDGIGSHANGNFCSGGASGFQSCSGATAAGGVDANGNSLDGALCAAVDGSLVWKSCALLGTTAQTPASSFSAILGTQYASAQAAAAATTCATGTATAADVDPEDYKRVVVSVRWGKHRTQQSTLVANPGSSAGPAVTGLTMNPSGNPVTAKSPSSLTLAFTATTSRPPAAVNWSIDGDVRGTASGTGTSWNFNWPLGEIENPLVLDGAYNVSARAVDAEGTSGATRAMTVTVNRRVPFPPTGVAAGRNNQVVELEWSANPERDIVGYQAYRKDSGGDTQVCPATAGASQVAITCQDTSPPNLPLLQYYVVALDRGLDGAARKGDQSAVVDVTQVNQAPNPPTNLTASADGGGTTLNWQAPVPPDPDSGDSIAFYRVYRDGQTYAARYDRTDSGSELSYTDSNTGGQAHTYYVTAVDGQLAESTIVGPVTQ